jgi:superoxide dismutase, Fe-Mn family
MPFELPPLPYAEDALAPHVSAETLRFHHGKHHATYVKKLNDFVAADQSLQGKSLEEIILSSEGGVFDNAAQVWNHTFFWSSMGPDGGGEPSGDLASAIESSFGSVDGFRKEFTEAATTVFGSGWTWLVRGDDGLEIMQTADADLPMKHGRTALLTLDVWEHAYYLDYQNRRPDFVAAFLEHLVNWEFAEANLRG